MLAKTLESKTELAEKKAREKQEKWQLIKDEGLRKTTIEERRVFADETKATAKLLAEENKIMTLNRDDMDGITQQWHDMSTRGILKRRMLAAVGWCFGARGLFPSRVGTSVPDTFSAPGYAFGARVGTSADDELGGGDDINGGGVE
ncbi:TGACG-sequence-specific DNA-binding protein TGA-2.1 [Hordeum vulgare]|nr:TGACG-sequence-specific DNA-binding protein TGA-2.1 [Hordeum vulgare]